MKHLHDLAARISHAFWFVNPQAYIKRPPRDKPNTADNDDLTHQCTPRAMAIPLEIARLICEYIGTEPTQDDVDYVRSQDVTRNLQSVRLLSRSFAAAGGEVLFRRFDMSFSRLGTCALTVDTERGPRRRCTCRYCHPLGGAFAALRDSHLASGVRELCFRIDLDSQDGPRAYDLWPEANPYPHLSLITEHYCNVESFRLVVQDGHPPLWNHEEPAYVDLQQWLAVANFVTMRLLNLKRMELSYPSWLESHVARLRCLDQIQQLRQKREGRFRLQVADPGPAVFHGGPPWVLVGRHTSPVPCQTPMDTALHIQPSIISPTGEVEAVPTRSRPLLSLSIEMFDDVLVDFANLVCAQLRELKIESLHTYNLHVFLVHARHSLRSLDVDSRGSDFIGYSWSSVIGALTSFTNLTRLKVRRWGWCGHTRDGFHSPIPDHLSLEQLPSLRVPGLQILDLTKIFARPADIARFLTDNRSSLRSVNLRECYLRVENGGTRGLARPPMTRQTCMPVIEALAACELLEALSLESLTSFPCLFDFTTTLESSGRDEELMGPRDGEPFDPRRFPEHLQTIIYCDEHDDLDMNKEREIFHLIGEVVRIAHNRGNSHQAVGRRSSEYDQFSCRLEPGSANAYFASLWPLADIRTGRADYDDVYPWNLMRE